jgi:hypothetical protein
MQGKSCMDPNVSINPFERRTKMTASRLSERALLVHVSCHSWTGRKKDNAVTDGVCSRANADSDAGAWWTYLCPPKLLKPIDTAQSRVKRKFEQLTLPMYDNGYRILPASQFMKFRDEITKLIRAHDVVAAEFVNKVFPVITTEAAKKKRLGTLAQTKYIHFPSAAQLKERFRVTMDIIPLPEVEDFRTKMGDDELAIARQEVKETYERSTQKAMQEVWMRLTDLVSNVAKTMGERDKKFRDSIIVNLRNFCELLPAYNVTGDKSLESMRREVVNKLASLNPEDLREIPNNRKAAAKTANDILAKISQYATQ